MSVTSYFSIAFSYDLAHADADTKKGALVKLQDYFEAKPEINTGDETYHPVSYAVTPFLDGSINLSETFKAKVVHAELTESQSADVQRLGFSTRVVGPAAFEFFPKPESPEVRL